jgi:hypothetical protein
MSYGGTWRNVLHAAAATLCTHLLGFRPSVTFRNRRMKRIVPSNLSTDAVNVDVESVSGQAARPPAKQAAPRLQLSRVMESDVGAFVVSIVFIASSYFMWHGRGSWLPLFVVWIPILMLGVAMAPRLTEEVLGMIESASVATVLCPCRTPWRKYFSATGQQICRWCSCPCLSGCCCCKGLMSRCWQTVSSCFAWVCCCRCLRSVDSMRPERESASDKLPASGAKSTLVEDILALSKLKDAGIINEEEFALAKKKLLKSKSE